MVRQADPTKFGFQVGVASSLLLLGILDALTLLRGNLVLGVLGLFIIPVAATWLVLSIRRLRQERARHD